MSENSFLRVESQRLSRALVVENEIPKQEILFYFIVSNDLMLFRKRLDNVHWADYSSMHDFCLASNFQSD